MSSIRERFLAHVASSAAGDGLGMEFIAQFIASACTEADRHDYNTFITEVLEQTGHLMRNESMIWSELMPGPGGLDDGVSELVAAFFLAEDLGDLQVKLSEQLSGCLQGLSARQVIEMEDLTEKAGLANIRLPFSVKIYFSADDGVGETVYTADWCEFFKDEHDIQWVKFFAKNGYDINKEHMLRTDINGFRVVRDA